MTKQITTAIKFAIQDIRVQITGDSKCIEKAIADTLMNIANSEQDQCVTILLYDDLVNDLSEYVPTPKDVENWLFYEDNLSEHFGYLTQGNTITWNNLEGMINLLSDANEYWDRHKDCTGAFERKHLH